MVDAARFYATQPASEPASPPAAESSAATEPPNALSEDAMVRAMYPPANWYPDVKEALQGYADGELLSSAEVDRMNAEVSEVFADLEVPHSDAGAWMRLILKHEETPVDPEQSKQWNKELRREFRERYGEEEMNRRLGAVKDVLDQFPDFRDLLMRTKLASHPDIVRPLVERAFSLLARYPVTKP